MLALLTDSIVSDWAKNSPWILLSFLILLGLWRAAKWAGFRLFGEDGILPKFVEAHKQFLDGVQKTQASSLVAMGLVNESLVDLEKRVERAYAAKHSDPEAWRILFAENPTPMSVVGAGHNFLHVNRAACRFFGYTETELRLMKWQDVTDGSDIQADLAEAEATIDEQKDGYVIEKSYKTKSGRLEEARAYVFRFPRIGQFQNLFCIMIPKNFPG